MSENVSCLTFGDWVFQNSCFQLHPFTCEFHNFIFLNNQIILLCKCTVTRSSVGGHLRCFCFLAITNRAATSTANSDLDSSKRASEYQLQSDTAGSYGRPISSSLRNRLTDFHDGRQFYCHQQAVRECSSFPHPCQHVLSFAFFFFL